MPPKAANGAADTYRHQWRPEERDTLRILYDEYNLSDADTFSIFTTLFPWAVGRHVVVKDHYTSRNANNRSEKWGRYHTRNLNDFNLTERTNRATARVQIIQAARGLPITLTPTPAILALHNTALTTIQNAPPGTTFLPVYADHKALDRARPKMKKDGTTAAPAVGSQAPPSGWVQPTTQGFQQTGAAGAVAGPSTLPPPPPATTQSTSSQSNPNIPRFPSSAIDPQLGGSNFNPTGTASGLDNLDINDFLPDLGNLPPLAQPSILQSGSGVTGANGTTLPGQGFGGVGQLVQGSLFDQDAPFDQGFPEGNVTNEPTQTGGNATLKRSGGPLESSGPKRPKTGTNVDDTQQNLPGVSQAVAINQPTEPEDKLEMVHQKDVKVNPNFNANRPAFRVSFENLFDTGRVWENGGEVIRALVMDMGDPRGTERDVMICDAKLCPDCGGSGTMPNTTSSGLAIPLVHFRQCSPEPAGASFVPLVRGRRVQKGRMGEARQAKWLWFSRGDRDKISVQASVCVPSSCEICTLTDGIGGPIPIDPPAQVSSNTALEETRITFSNVLALGPPFLPMVHRSDLVSGLLGGLPVEGEPLWQVEQVKLFGPTNPMYKRGGPVIRMRIRMENKTTGKSVNAYGPVMVCDREHCGNCAGENALPGPSPYRGFPFIHSSEFTQPESFTPPEHSTLLTDDATTTEATLRPIRYDLQNNSQIVVTAVCNRGKCTLCPLPAEPNKLKMVHYVDAEQVNRPVVGAPRYRTTTSNMFDDSHSTPSFVETWRRGGPVINIQVTGDSSGYHHVMLCDVAQCQYCISKGLSGMSANPTGDFYKGLPFVHTSECTSTVSGLLFDPIGNETKAVYAIKGGDPTLSDVTYFQAGVPVVQKSMICQSETCAKCNPREATGLKLVHRRDLQPDGFPSRYRCQRSDIKGREDLEWHQGGPVMSVFIAETQPRQDMEVMVCQFQACEGCRDGTSPERTHVAYRLPFVHSKDCTANGGGGRVTFRPDPIARLDQGIDCPVTQRQVIYPARGGPFDAPPRLTSAVCVRTDCEICSRTEEGLQISLGLDGIAPGEDDGDDPIDLDQQDFTAETNVGNGGGNTIRPTGQTTNSSGGTGTPSTTRPIGKKWPPTTGPKAPRKQIRERTPERVQPPRVAKASSPAGGSSTSGGVSKPPPTKPTTKPTTKPATKPTTKPTPSQTIPSTTTTTAAPGGNALPGGKTTFPTTSAIKTTLPATSAAPAGGTATTNTAAPPAGTAVIAVTPGAANLFRMCHYRHLEFAANSVTWSDLNSRGNSKKIGGVLVNNYFLPNTGLPWEWRGAVYRVNFPNGTVQDVMSCRRLKCKTCQGKRNAVASPNALRFPFAHRRELVPSAATGFNFVPIFRGRDHVYTDDANMATVTARFGRAGNAGASAIITQCHTCTAGNCPDDCDVVESEEEEEEGEVEEEEEAEEEEQVEEQGPVEEQEMAEGEQPVEGEEPTQEQIEQGAGDEGDQGEPMDGEVDEAEGSEEQADDDGEDDLDADPEFEEPDDTQDEDFNELYDVSPPLRRRR